MDMQWEKLLSSARRKDKYKKAMQEEEAPTSYVTPPISTGRLTLDFQKPQQQLMLALPEK
ncbi:hypothetical protein GCM10011513_34380 [Franconibacter daqui]|uniref:hypothetical protein n=1 Tax=Franconibacter daqui TaxID=2047724 RepID=UPI00166C73B3|nr:hypothetical protein [Franconibacter daqui]GGD33760.1 hypothetical protein GCM10011513_34380 [Franconibacter daqui]